MAFREPELKTIFDRIGGRCFYCRKMLAFSNYGRRGARGGWEVDHRRPRANGGTDHGRNLAAACWTCNVSKSDLPAKIHAEAVQGARELREWNDIKRAACVAAPLAILAGIVAEKLLQSHTAAPADGPGLSEDKEEARKQATALAWVPLAVGIGGFILLVLALRKIR